jgi:hypothetical protein
MGEEGFSPTRRNVSVQISVDGYKVDLTPGTLQNPNTDDHSIYRRKAYTWTKTNVRTHQAYVLDGGRTQETRLTKLWRDQHALDFPSFYLELVVIRALYGQYGSLPQNLFELFRYLVREFHDARFVDPANSNNVVSDDLTNAEKGLIVAGAEEALAATIWEEIVR